jgi:pantoate--beta-alanine ligase
MILFKRAGDLAGWLQRQRKAGKEIGFVPTMGALHPGHISLIDISKRSMGITVCSIFVNPTQFNDPGDFQKYPITIEKDIYGLEKAGTDALFLPEPAGIYPGGTKDLEKYALGRLETILEGKYRPGHFQGVCQVVRRLLDIVQPDDLYMGQKDYQQCMVVRRLLDIIGSPTRLHPCPILREADGLAMSSRNMRLTEEERKKAPAIYQALTGLKERWRSGIDQAKSLARARAVLENNGFRMDYVEIADALTLGPVSSPAEQQPAVALIAAFLGEVRLIDNMALDSTTDGPR